MDEYLTIPEIADALSVNYAAIRYHIKEGRLRTAKKYGRIVVQRESFDQFLEGYWHPQADSRKKRVDAIKRAYSHEIT